MSDGYIKVSGYNNLSRSRSTGAIVNTDDEARQAYRANKARRLAEQTRMKNLESEVESLKKDISDMNTKMDMMLKLLMSGKDN